MLKNDIHECDQAVETILSILQEKYPDLDPKEFLQGPFSKAVFGDIPAYSNRRNHLITNVTMTTVHAFSVCYHIDRKTHESHFILLKRQEKMDNGNHKYGALGGFVTLDPIDEKTAYGEQPYEGAVREIAEETVDNEGNPVLNISPNRLILIYSGVDYRGCSEDVQGTQNTGYMLELNDHEFSAMVHHNQSMDYDENYREAVIAHTQGETHGFVILTARDFSKMSPLQFSHPHDYEGHLKVSKFINSKISPSMLEI